MRYLLTPGNSLACRVNNHRHGWTGAICTNAQDWNCLAPKQFRTDYCASGDARCFHVHAFDPADPHIVFEHNGAAWLLDTMPDALDDQVLFLWGKRATTDRGIPEVGPTENVVFGVYRVRSVEAYGPDHMKRWRIRPHDDGWARFVHLNVGLPRYEDLGGPYLKQLDRYNSARILNEGRASSGFADPVDAERFLRACRSLPAWTAVAAKRVEALRQSYPDAFDDPLRSAPTRAVVGTVSVGSLGSGSKPLKQLGDLKSQLEARAKSEGPAGATSPAPEAAARAHASGLEPKAAAWIREVHGPEFLLEVEVALATRELLVLRGAPGVGKSHLAVGLVDDPQRERTLVVPVSATWRGREDLLGYVNPIHGRFEATPFTVFLEQAAAAWRRGDRALRIVVFEEFNLSQPEHWLADVLAVSQFESERDRAIQLAGGSGTDRREVFLSPAVRFVATVNDDHTTRQLSPRVLDRAAVVRLELTAKEALSRLGLVLEEDLVRAIADLDDLLQPRGASFSIRTAQALRRCLAMESRPSPVVAVDVVLLQQVLSKVRLAAHDPADAALLREIENWSAEQGAALSRCVELVSEWRELLDNGRDVTLA
jgi:hypothetical protein